MISDREHDGIDHGNTPRPMDPLTVAWFKSAMTQREDGLRTLTPPLGSMPRDLAGMARIWIGAAFGGLVILAVAAMVTAPMWAR